MFLGREQALGLAGTGGAGCKPVFETPGQNSGTDGTFLAILLFVVSRPPDRRLCAV